MTRVDHHRVAAGLRRDSIDHGRTDLALRRNPWVEAKPLVSSACEMCIASLQVLHFCLQSGTKSPPHADPAGVARLVQRHGRQLQRKECQMPKNTSVIGIYPDRNTVSDAINVLRKAGYRTTDVSVLSSDNQGSKDFAHEKRTKALEGAAIGAATGAVIGAALAWLVSTQTVPIAALAPLVDAGPVLAAIAGAGAFGTLCWVVGFLAGMRFPEYVAKRYAGRIRRGGILMSVHCDSQEWCDRAKKTLKDTGARQISSASEAAADYGTTDKPTERAPATLVERVEAPARQAAEPIAHESKQ